MIHTRRHPAPWGTALMVITLAVCGLLVLVWLVLLRAPERMGLGRTLGLVLAPLMMLVGSLFVVRGYEIRGRELRVARLCWWTRIPLEGLKSAQADPTATRASLRLWGNGGFFSFSGWFANRRLGRYRLLATDVPRSVVLLFADRRPVVVTPADPTGFIQEVREVVGLPKP